MKEIIFNKKEYEDYKDFYHDVYIKLNGKENRDFDFCGSSLGYSADILDEFLWYYNSDGNKYIFKNFDRAKISQRKNFDDYKYDLALGAFEDFAKNYSNNLIEFADDEKEGLV